MSQKIVLGATYRDLITGYTGVAVGHVVYITGCNQTLIAGASKDGGTPPDSCWFDDVRLEKQPNVIIKLSNSSPEKPGGDKLPGKI